VWRASSWSASKATAWSSNTWRTSSLSAGSARLGGIASTRFRGIPVWAGTCWRAASAPFARDCLDDWWTAAISAVLVVVYILFAIVILGAVVLDMVVILVIFVLDDWIRHVFVGYIDFDSRSRIS
jgi:hypothetical protein